VFSVEFLDALAKLTFWLGLSYSTILAFERLKWVCKLYNLIDAMKRNVPIIFIISFNMLMVAVTKDVTSLIPLL
jgi:hypothetical protein